MRGRRLLAAGVLATGPALLPVLCAVALASPVEPPAYDPVPICIDTVHREVIDVDVPVVRPAAACACSRPFLGHLFGHARCPAPPSATPDAPASPTPSPAEGSPSPASPTPSPAQESPSVVTPTPSPMPDRHSAHVPWGPGGSRRPASFRPTHAPAQPSTPRRHPQRPSPRLDAPQAAPRHSSARQTPSSGPRRPGPGRPAVQADETTSVTSRFAERRQGMDRATALVVIFTGAISVTAVSTLGRRTTIRRR
ncbi:hypothetical protein ACIBHX_48220 [Nonomuraea sp. NPDC050536]|uniref:hypothetical protein n=1 Tax=Nonomuraea sp. NPDC050536 TaxID=3364366 RepID=UPI0037CC3B22